MRPHKMVSGYLILVLFSQPVKQLSDCSCKLDCGWFASVREEWRAAHCLLKFVVLEAQHDAVLRVGGYPAVPASPWTAGVQIFPCSLCYSDLTFKT